MMGGQRSVLSYRKKWINKHPSPQKLSEFFTRVPSRTDSAAPLLCTGHGRVCSSARKRERKAKALQIPVVNSEACVWKWGWLATGTAQHGKWWICHLWMSSNRGWMLPRSPIPKPSPGAGCDLPWHHNRCHSPYWPQKNISRMQMSSWLFNTQRHNYQRQVPRREPLVMQAG